MVFHPSPKFPCLGISSSRTWPVLMSLLQTMAENILWDHGLGAEAGIGFFMCICRWPCTGSWLPYFIIMQTLNLLHQTYSSGIFSIPSFLGYVLHLFSAVRIYVSRCIPPLHPHFLHLFLSITSSWFILPVALSLLILGFVHMFVRVSFMLEGFLRCPMTLGCPALKRMALIEAVRKRLCLILQVVWPQDVSLDGVLSLSP